MELVWQQTFPDGRCVLATTVVGVGDYGASMPLGVTAATKHAVGAERVRRRPMLAAEVAVDWQEQLDEHTRVAVGLTAVVTADDAARQHARDGAREATAAYRRAVRGLEGQLKRDPVAAQLLRATLSVTDDVVETAEWLAEHPATSAEGVAGTWHDLIAGAHFCQYLVRDYLPLARMSLPERVGAAAWRERLWLNPSDIERTYRQAAAESATPRQRPDGTVLVVMPPITDRRTALERLKDQLRSGRRGCLIAQAAPTSVPEPFYASRTRVV